MRKKHISSMLIKTTYTEGELVALIRQNNKKGFDYLYSNYGVALSVVIFKAVNDKQVADTILRDVFVNVWKNINQYDPAKGRLYIWMHNIAVNKCKNCRPITSN